MFPCAIKMYIPIFILFILAFANGQDRMITFMLNPGCADCDANERPLIYIRAEGSNDTIHQLWDFTDYVPGVVYAIGKPNSTLKINWHNKYPVKFNFSDKPSSSYGFAAAIESIIEYNDVKDNGYYDPECMNISWGLDNLLWRITESIFTDKEAMVMLRGEERLKNSTLDIKLDLVPFKDYATDLPHLIHTANSTLINIDIVNRTDYRTFNSSRYALRFVIVSSDPSRNSWTRSMRKSLDDEHTPGVFEIIEIKSPRTAQSGDGGFMQFRPVAYTEPERSVSSSTNVYVTGFNRTKLPERGILHPFFVDCFGARLSEPFNIVMQDMIISFGQPGDGFYKQHNFTSWSFTLGYGTPPLESFSLYVLIIISIGLGVPVIIAFSGVAYMLQRRCKHRNPPARFNNED